MSTTAKVTIPSHLLTAMSDADEAEWEIQRRAKTILFIPQQGKRVSIPYDHTEEQVRDALIKAGLYKAEPVQEEPAPAEQAAPEATPADDGETREETRLEQFSCPECGQLCGGGQGLSAHRRIQHGITNTTTRPGQISGTGLPTDIADAAQLLLSRVSAHLTQGAAQTSDAATEAELAEAKAALQKLTADKEQLEKKLSTAIDEIKSLKADNRDLRRVSTAKDRLEEQLKNVKAENRDLRRFKEKVEAEVSNQDQAPVQTVVNVIKAGGHGFALPKR
jgi:hypothetical protein